MPFSSLWIDPSGHAIDLKADHESNYRQLVAKCAEEGWKPADEHAQQHMDLVLAQRAMLPPKIVIAAEPQDHTAPAPVEIVYSQAMPAHSDEPPEEPHN